MSRIVPSKINAVLAEMTRDEIANTHRYLEIFQRWGSMSLAEADEWRRRANAWSAYLDLEDGGRGAS